MSKINKVLFVGIGDVAAAAVLKTVPPHKTFHFDDVEFPIMVRLGQISAPSEESFLEEVGKFGGEDALIVYVVNKQGPNDYVNYEKWISDINHHHMKEENYISKSYLLFIVAHHDDLNALRAKIVDSMANVIRQCNQTAIEVPDNPEWKYGQDGKVDRDIPRKVIIAIGQASNLLLNLARIDQSSNPDAGFAFVHDRDDYYLIPEHSDEDINNAFKEISERHTKFNEYVLLVDDTCFSNQTIENFHIRLLATARQDSVHLLIVNHVYTGPGHAQHGPHMSALKEALRVAEKVVKQHPAPEKEVEEESVPDNTIARKIIFVYGHEATNVLRLLDLNYSNYSSSPIEVLIDKEVDIVIEHTALGVAVANYDVNQLGRYYNEDCEVYLLGDKDIFSSEIGRYLRDHISANTDGRYSYTTVMARDPKYPNAYDMTLGLIVNDFRGMKQRLEVLKNPNNTNPTQQEAKMNQDQNEQQETKEVESPSLQQQIEAALKPVWERFHGVAQTQNEIKAALNQIQMTMRHGGVYGPLPNRFHSPLDKSGLLFPGPDMGLPFNDPGSAGMFQSPRFPFGAPPAPARAFRGAPLFSQAMPQPFGGNFANMRENLRSPRDTITRENEERVRASLYPAGAGRDFPSPEGGVGRGFGGGPVSPMPKYAPDEHRFDEDAYEVIEGIPAGLIRKVKPLGIVQAKNNGKKEILILSLSRQTSSAVVDVLRNMFSINPNPVDEVVTLTFGDLDSFVDGKFVGFEEICIVYQHGDLPAENYAASKRTELVKQHQIVNPGVSFRQISDRQFGSYLYGIWQGYELGFKKGISINNEPY